MPSPYGGWNTRDSLSSMSPTDAVVLDNFFPQVGAVELRKGHTSHVSGLGGNVETLAEYHSGTTRHLIACANGNIYNATSAATSLVSGLTNNRWSTANFNGRLFMVNGDDAPRDWDGTTLTSTAWSGTGLTISDLISVSVSKNRLYFVQKDSQDFWYAATNAITGTLTKFALSRVSTFGGKLIRIINWTRDSGAGMDDWTVFIMSSGDVIVYQGTNPGDANNWSLVGVYRIGEPINERTIIKVGGDVRIATFDDYVSLNEIVTRGYIGESSKLSGAIQDAARQYSANSDWDAVLFPEGSMLLFNIPVSTSKSIQHVVNTTTGAPCRFTGLNARSWARFNQKLYFGGSGVIYEYTGSSDNNANINATGQQAWSDLGIPNNKRVALQRSVIRTTGDTSYAMGVGFDFTNPAIPPVTTVSVSGASWDTATWDVDSWAPEETINDDWQVSCGEGVTLAPRLVVDSQQTTSWLRTDYQVEVGFGL